MDGDPRGQNLRDVERDFDVDASLFAPDGDALIGFRARRAAEYGVARGKLQGG